MASVTATINVQINAANAAAQLTALQSKVAAMNKGMLAATAGGVMAQEKAIRRMGTILSGSGMFTTGIRNVHTELGRMHQEFDRGSTSLQNYRKNSRMWGKDHSNINRMAADRVRMLQSQYVALGKEMNGVQQAMQIKPDKMMREFGADAEYAHQKSVLFRRNLQMGSTALVNWGKNTQWAGRQMMVGMGIPIAIAAAGAIKSFNDIEKSSISFKRVYGDATTSVAEKSQMLAKVQKTVGNEMMKYGIAMSDTLDVSAKAAATGARGADLIAATRETMRLATLGNMDYNKALEATIAMQTAFNINSKDMAKTTDFLNAVENQTILSMEDMALAVPRVAPVIKGLGGNVEELAIMMTALRQGGVSAEQGANALKSGLGSLLNPTGTAIEQFDQMGVNLKKIVETNKGDLIGTIQGLGKALDSLSKYDRQRALESLFGKYQYARMGALLKNINSKAVKETMRLAKAGNAELAKMSEQELGQISDSPMIKLKASIEELKAAAAPLGALFSDIAAKVISFATPVVSFFANNDAAKWGLVVGAGLAALAGTLTMVIGVFANFAGSMVKAGMSVRTFFRFITGQRSLAYITTDGLEASAAANSLATAAERAAGGMMAEAKAAQLLTSQLEALIAAQNGAAATSRRPGATAIPTAPAGTVPTPGAAPRGASQAEILAMTQKEGTTVRSHVGQPVVLNATQLKAVKDYHAAGVAKGQKTAIEFTNAADKGLLRGYSSVALGWGATTNMELSDSAKSLGVEKSRLLSQLNMRPQEVIAPFIDDLARNSGMTTQQVASDPRVQRWADGAVNAIHSGIASSTLERFKDSDIERIASPILGSVKDVAPEYAKGYQKMLLPEEYGIPGQSRVSLQKGVIDKAPDQFATYRPKTVKTSEAVSTANTYMPNLRISGGEEVTPNGLVVPKGTMAEQRQTANTFAKSGIVGASSFGSTGGKKLTYSASQLQSALASRSVAASTRQTQPGMSKFGMRGMGLMGAGMLGSTAFMGLEMAGKQVPMAANLAVNGLMGIGMAAQMFPKASDAVATRLASVATALGPLGIAVGATAAVVAGSALLWRTLNQKWRRDGVRLGEATTNATQGLEETGQIFGKQGYVERQIASDEGATQEKMTLGEEFLKSDVGKRWLDDYANTAGEAGVATASGSLAAKLATAVVNGVMGTGDVKGVFAALTKENAVMSAGVRSDFLNLVGGSMKNIDPFAASLAINRQNQMQTQALLGASQQKIAAATPEPKPGIFSSGGETRRFRPVDTETSIVKNMEMRSLMQQNAGLAAGAWSGTMATAFQNRLAAEAQLQQMMQARDDLAAKSDRTADETKQMNNLSRQIDNGTAALVKMDNQVHTTMDGLEKLYNDSDQGQKDAMSKSIFESLGQNDNKMTKLAGAMLEGSTIGDQRIKFTMAVALESGMLQPETLMNMFNQFGSADAAAQTMELAINTVGTAPAMDFFNSMATFKSGAQTRALQSFGAEFSRVAIKAKMSAKEASALAKALGANKAQQREVRVNVKAGKVVDPGDKIKANRKISVGANTEAAQQRIKQLAREAERVSGKKIRIRASDNAGEVIKKLQRIIDKADDINGKKPKVKVDADTSAAERKAAQVEAALSKGNPPPINITANDQATATMAGVGAQWMATAAMLSTPPTLSVNDQATAVIAGVVTQLAGVQSKTITITTNYVENKATGGLYRGYATGGIHSGDGKVIGPGGPTDDKVNARLSRGEFVIRASSVQKYGTAFLDAVNRGMYDKNGLAKGSPIKKAPFAPKDKKGESRAVEFGNEWRGMMFEVTSFLKEFSKMNKIIEFGSKKLKGGMKVLDYEFGKYLMDNYSPRQIKKMFKSGQVKKIQRQFTAENKLEARDQLRTGMYDQAAAAMANSQVGRYGGMASAYQGLSGDDMKLAASQPKLFKKIMGQRAAIEKESQIGQFKSQVVGSDAAIAGQLGDSGLAKAAEQLGMSMTDIANAMANGYTAQQIKELGSAAEKAAEQLAIALMEPIDRLSEQADNLGQIVSLYGQKAEAAGRQAIATDSGKWGIDGVASGMGVNQLNALMGVNQANADIWQAQIDDINKDYEKQLEIFDQISQQQQAIANLERGRMSVANALSTGDIAAAAMAAQQQRSETASFMQSQMRTQLENQQKAKTLSLQNQIDDALKVNRDIQNQINMAMAIAAKDVAAAQDDAQKQADTILIQNTLIDQQIAKLNERNAALAAGGVIPPPPGIPTPDGTGSGSSPTAPPVAQGEVLWNLANSGISRLGDKDFKFIKKQVFKGKDKSNNAWKDVFSGFSSDKKNLLISVVSNGSVSSSEEALIKKKFATGGWVPGTGSRDTVPIMATPGEFVMRKAAAARFGPMLTAMNSGSLKGVEANSGGTSIGSVVFNINGANLDEKAVADIAVRKMRSLDSATIRGGRF